MVVVAASFKYNPTKMNGKKIFTLQSIIIYNLYSFI